MNEEGVPDTGDPAALPLPDPELRDQVINAAVTFLQNPNIKRNPISQKQNFLRTKGLSEDEIQIACERAGVFTNDQNSTVINMGITRSRNLPGNVPAMHLQHVPMTTMQKIKEILTSTALVAGITYAIYLFYKNYIEPFLFGRRKKRKTLDESIDELNKNVEKNIFDLNRELTKVKEELRNVSQNDALQREIRSFKSDLDAIKGLLLNRKQFSSPVLPPSIPVWQLQSQHTQVDIEVDKNDDTGSGSGSSETEVVTKNSDSSLELIS